jgi:sigma-B regulation protein RsbU (phosphoserine phosphatase)
MMGFDPYDQVPVTEIVLEPGDRMLLYTDGVSERFNTDRQPYGEERLCRKMEQTGRGGPQELLKGIVQDLDNFAGGLPADDDQAMLLLSFE